MSFEEADVDLHAKGCGVLEFLREIESNNPVLFHQIGWNPRRCSCHSHKVNVPIGIEKIMEKIVISHGEEVRYSDVLRVEPFKPSGLIHMHAIQKSFGANMEIYKQFRFETFECFEAPGASGVEICCQLYRCKEGEYTAYVDKLRRLDKAIGSLATFSRQRRVDEQVDHQLVDEILTPAVMMEVEAKVLREMIASLPTHGTRFVSEKKMRLEYGRVYPSTMDHPKFDKFKLFKIDEMPPYSAAPLPEIDEAAPVMMIRYEYDFKGRKTSEWVSMLLRAVDSALAGNRVDAFRAF
jgi:hypothetical protein